ncbi:hypothetical protein [Peribacillus sp. FSL M8-0224]|jgi:hypothetical protein|uniref:hypothetical protein n=1 Tax=Peribacillus sp. FSL M8-0224 TaxID=2921568 RepID=UPI0030F57FA1|nr:hypothetical protein KY492_06360 [Brevibacterium sp. PAMC21349]
MKSIRNLIIVAITVTIIGTSIFLVNSNSTRATDESAVFEDLGRYIKSLKEDEKEKRNLTNEILDKNQYLILIKFYQNNEPTMTTDEAKEIALAQIIEETAIKEKAKELSIFPSQEEVTARVQEERFKFENANDEDPDNKQVQEMLNSLMEGLGMNADEYWGSYVPTGYEFTISQEKLYEEVTKEITEVDQKNEKWNTEKENYIGKFKEVYKDEISELKNN